MKCNICGAEFDIGERVCKYCGNELELSEMQELEYYRINNPDVTKTVDKTKQPVPGQREEYKFCTKCGRPLDKVTNKCIVCAEKQAINQVYRQNTAKEKQEENDMADSRKRKHQKKKENKTVKFLIILIVLAVLLVASALIGYEWINKLLNGNSDSSPQTGSDVVTTTSIPVNSPEIVTKAPAEAKERETEKPIATEKPTPVPTPKVTEPPTSNPEEVINYHGGTYLFPSYEEVITRSELQKLNRKTVKLILQEIYARYGYTFEDDDLVEYFESQSWYMPTTTDIDEVEKQFNEYEKENVEIIENYQREQGWRI